MDSHDLGPDTHIDIEPLTESLRGLHKQFFTLSNHATYIIR